MVVVHLEPSSRSERPDEAPEWTPEDVEWMARMADSWEPVTEAEETFREIAEGWSQIPDEEEPWWLRGRE